MEMGRTFVLVLLLCVLYYTQAEEVPIVKIPGGKIKGRYRENFYEFNSIPYAEPPVGEKRFEPSTPYTSEWEGVRDATLPPNACMQWDEFYTGGEDLLHGEEDCLYLNVFTPSIEGDQLYPVIIHIHGGAFMFGSGDLYGPERLLKETKLVVVTFNYRLGPLGFLSTEDEQISGNMGLKDQVLAIKWVKENIHIFKGNPENITLTGFSAGGASVHFHLLAKQTQGLFNAAISHSGTVFCAWVLIRNPLERAKILAAHLDCPKGDTKILKNCLKEKDAKDIVRAVQYFQPYMYNPFTVFGPVIEAPINTAFITEDMETIIKEGRTAKVPWIVSYAEDEGGYNALTLMKRDSNGNIPLDSFDEKWSTLAPLMLFYNETISADQHASYAEELKRRYLGDEQISSKSYRKFQKMFTDQLYLVGITKSIRLHTEYSKSPVYVYHYNKPLPGGAGLIITKRTDIDFGTIHGDDVYLIFNTPFAINSLFTEKEDQMTKNFADLFVSFSKTGIPKFNDIEMPDNCGSPKEWKVLKINDVNNYEIETIN